MAGTLNNGTIRTHGDIVATAKDANEDHHSSRHHDQGDEDHGDQHGQHGDH